MSYLVLDKELDTLNGGGSGLRDGGGNTTHCGNQSVDQPFTSTIACCMDVFSIALDRKRSIGLGGAKTYSRSRPRSPIHRIIVSMVSKESIKTGRTAREDTSSNLSRPLWEPETPYRQLRCPSKVPLETGHKGNSAALTGTPKTLFSAWLTSPLAILIAAIYAN